MFFGKRGLDEFCLVRGDWGKLVRVIWREGTGVRIVWWGRDGG